MINWIKSEFGLSSKDILRGIYENSALLLLCVGAYFLITSIVPMR